MWITREQDKLLIFPKSITTNYPHIHSPNNSKIFFQKLFYYKLQWG